MIKKITQYILGISLVAVALVACDKDYPSIVELDGQSIQDYMAKNNLNMTKYTFNDTSEFFYQVVTPGSGPDLKYSDQTPVLWTVRSLDGRYVSTDTFAVSQRYGASGQFLGYLEPKRGYPEPLRIGVVELLKKRGGKIRLIIPSRFAYGRNGRGDIPGNASLDYTLSVLDTNDIASYDEMSIQKFMQANNLTGFTRTANGMYYKVNEPGTGSPITVDSTVTAEYTGRLLNGSIFDKSQNVSFTLTNVIKGWQQGVPLIKQGGSIRLIIPSKLAYGFAGSGTSGFISIPTASCLDFDVKVTDVTK